MDGPAPEPIDAPVDPKLEELLRQELAVPRAAQERTMDGLALKLDGAAALQRARAKNAWWPRLLAAAVMVALMLGLFALLALTRNTVARNKTPETDTSLASSKGSDKKETKDEQPIEPVAETDPPLTAQDLPKLLHGVEAGNPSERNIGTRRLSHGGLFAKDALEKEVLVLTRAGNKPEELKRINEVIELVRKEEDKEVERDFALLEQEPQNKPLYAAPAPLLAQKLQHKVTFEFVDTSVEEALAFLTQGAGVRMALDPKLTTRLPNVNLRVTDMSCDLALDWAAQMAGLTRVNRGNVVLLTTPERAHRLMLQKQSFQLPVAKGEAPWTADEVKSLCELLPPGSIEPGDKGAVVATDEPQKLAELAQTLKLFSDNSTPQSEIPEWVADVNHKLQRRVTFEFVDLPLEEAINFLNSLTRVNIIIDPRFDLKKAPPVTFSAQNVELCEALYQILRKTGGAADIRNQAVFITKGPLVLPGTLHVFDLQPALNATVPPDALRKALDEFVNRSNLQAPNVRIIRNHWCGNIDVWTAERIRVLLEDSIKAGKLADLHPEPWFFRTLRNSEPVTPVIAPRQTHRDPEPAPKAPEKKRDEF